MPAHVLDPCFDSLRREFDVACHESAARAAEEAKSQAKSEQLQTLNQLFRRFRAYQTESEWIQTTLDAASHFADYVAVFGISNETMQLRGQAPIAFLQEEISVPLNTAAAFRSAVESKDPVTALRSASEVSPLLSEGDSSERVHIFPITNGDRVSAVLFAPESGADMNALELVTSMASSVLERKANVALHAQIAAIEDAPKPPLKFKFQPFEREILEPISWSLDVPEPSLADPLMQIPVVRFPVVSKPDTHQLATSNPALPAVLPAWSDLPSDQRQLHIRAQRFARVTVAEMQLARPEACRAGREQSDLYLFLKREIDKARENYRKQFMTVPSMVDYLHLELIQTAAQGDEHKLGADYPGRLF